MLIAVPLFTALGTWQLERAETKRGLRAEVAARWDAAPASLPARPDWTTLEHSRVTVEGAFVDERQFVINDRLHHGRRGLHVVTPLRLVDGSELLVNRGWVADDGAVEPPPGGIVRLTGRVKLPLPPALELGPAAPATDPWNAPWSRLDPTGYAAVAGTEPLPAALLLDPDQPHGFVRDWPRPTGGLAPALHVGYALQWFAFALLAAGIWLWRSLRRGTTARDPA
jgi:surfeit locus 1 family protein